MIARPASMHASTKRELARDQESFQEIVLFNTGYIAAAKWKVMLPERRVLAFNMQPHTRVRHTGTQQNHNAMVHMQDDPNHSSKTT